MQGMLKWDVIISNPKELRIGRDGGERLMTISTIEDQCPVIAVMSADRVRLLMLSGKAISIEPAKDFSE